ncbi:aminodeoxychorismate synthase component I [Vibrio ostreicida]|uniref:aminodeoxychorismate synthase n=1 Tax=Vibrio ostreicida TaxID=526588 RepID=A0ABT8BTA9_9VIBR|nr:aminodeoxychorismate synthase component I [Vibrio ostreicida]MDN3610216.1 aminodeoxychorismate synthase component I [Vibrio ostreicida]NPD07764.1 aminodeoxychorismate synthase component I [Vibrio ostreicida]
MNNNAPNCLKIKPIAYHPALSKQLFSRIESQPWSMLLHSASEHHVDSRFDIIVAKPLATLTTLGPLTRIRNPQASFESDADPFTLIEQQQSQWLPKLDYMGELPFVGGALGYFSYDLGRRVEALPAKAHHDLTTPDMAIGLYDWAVIIDHHQQSACVVGQQVEDHYDWLLSHPEPNCQPFTLLGPWQSNMTKQNYTHKFNRVQEYLRSGDCYQINLAQRFKAPYSGSEWHAYQKLEAVNKGPFSAFIRTEQGAIISVSPERFLKLNNREIETKPIKGTRPRHVDKTLDEAEATALSQSEKDQAENLMIVDLLRNDIGKVAQPGTVHVPKLFDIESFPAVHHLVSTIRATLASQYSATDLLRASFPGGSITGAPKIRAMEIIEELEPHRRSAYCGSIGYISRHGAMDTSITIRTLIAEKAQIYVWAGGGLVADSKSNAEYQETLDKLCRILPTLE